MTLEQIRNELKQRKISVMAPLVGLHKNCLYRIMHGISDPRSSTLEKLRAYFSKK